MSVPIFQFVFTGAKAQPTIDFLAHARPKLSFLVAGVIAYFFAKDPSGEDVPPPAKDVAKSKGR
jgi:hypothetical protein